MVTTRRQSLAARPSQPRAEGGWVRQPCEQKPPFTVGQLRKAIPAHCWQRSAWRSGAYLALDVLLLAALVYASSFIDAAPVPSYVKWGLLWPLYWFFAGGVGTGCWVSSIGGGGGGGCCRLARTRALPPDCAVGSCVRHGWCGSAAQSQAGPLAGHRL